MEYFIKSKLYKPKKLFLRRFIKRYWFIPSDVLQRSIEANIWSYCKFKHPVLSIGIGNGKIDVILFHKHGKLDVGIDYDPEQLEDAKKLGIYKKVLHVNAEKMPFKDKSFYTVISNSTFEHIKNDKKAISEVARVLKPGGLFFFTVPSNFLKKWIIDFEKGNEKKLKAFNKRTNHFHYHTVLEWENLLKENNLELVLHQYYFPKKIALYWYILFKIFTSKKRNKEIWSYLGHSRITKYTSNRLVLSFIEKILLNKAFESGFLTNSQIGAQHFIVAKKGFNL